MKPAKLFRTDSRQTKSLISAGINSAKNAIRQSKALDLPITYIKDDAVYVEDKFGLNSRVLSYEKNSQKI